HKNELVKNFSENNIEKINELLSELEKKQIEIFKNDFIKADEKAKRIVARPFVVKQSKKESDPKEKEVESDIIFDGEVKARKSKLWLKTQGLVKSKFKITIFKTLKQTRIIELIKTMCIKTKTKTKDVIIEILVNLRKLQELPTAI
ncbi:hypothetical protein BpHYR1_008144, partial [Brachionus plicatilis]